MTKQTLCVECSLPILADDDVVSLPDVDDDSPWHGSHYHAECYEERD